MRAGVAAGESALLSGLEKGEECHVSPGEKKKKNAMYSLKRK